MIKCNYYRVDTLAGKISNHCNSFIVLLASVTSFIFSTKIIGEKEGTNMDQSEYEVHSVVVMSSLDRLKGDWNPK